MKNQYKEKWNSLLKNNYFPSYLRKIKTYDFKDFTNIVINHPKKTNEIIQNMFLGDSLVIKNVFDKETINNLKNEIYNLEIESTESKENLKILEDCPNYHKSNKKEDLATVLDNYDETAHSHFFFRWNGDNLNIFKHFEELWNSIKIISGLNAGDYKKNTPKDLVVDRIQVLRYPLNKGYITTHCDLPAWQKLNMGICLSEKGDDFDLGGLYLLDKNEKKINIEENLKIGDCFCWVPSIFHGVDVPKNKNNDNPEWNSKKGRWQAIALTVQSHYVKDRILSVGHKKFKENPETFKETYRKAALKYNS